MTEQYTVNVLGTACRLPGAPHESTLWSILDQGLSTVGTLPPHRWNPELHFHPNPRAPGSAYTFAGGYLPDPYGFDIGVFGMSPREAAQLDPQQRLLAEVVWDALEDARIAPSSLAGSEVGVYIGVSALDHANLFGGDTGAIESHFMSGNTLSIVANRISYLFDLRGPSLAIDTACSSSLVAVDRAMADLASGRIDTAIVGGVNMLLSPAAFIGFSRASMLSPTGACRPFSADGDGYVRSEGAVAFVLRREKTPADRPVRAIISASAVNSDGRTSGIALPGLDGQVALLERVYRQAELEADDIDFVEAHGTGTAVGDPIEAMALGKVLGMRRSRPLPIGSVKSNIGHLEPASGVAGMMKAVLALEKRSLPATLHLEQLSPHIDFERLNLSPAAKAVHFEPNGRLLACGVSSFGFGGTNAHVVLTSAPQRALSRVGKDWKTPEALVISAACRDALLELAAGHAKLLKAGAAPARLADAVAAGRQTMRHRAVLPLGPAKNMASDLEKFASGQKAPRVLTGTAPAQRPKICFVYSGNGTQWVGMGRTAYNENPDFAKAFDKADQALRDSGLDSIREAMFADDLADRIGTAACAQPLIFGIQVGVTAALAARGVEPRAVLGHSVGEIAAAHAAGILDLAQAARILAARAHSQEAVCGAGGMATFAASRMDMVRFIEGLTAGPIGIAADNAPNSVTISGSADAIDLAMKAARRARIAGRRLDIDYPYHSELLDSIRDEFLMPLGVVQTKAPVVSMYSTVTGKAVDDASLDALYWWRNVRSEVLFQQAVKAAGASGCNLFIEISPRPIMVSPVSSTLDEAGHSVRVIHSLSEADDGKRAIESGWTDPIGATAARAIAHGLDAPRPSLGRHSLDRSAPLPGYPWQRRSLRAANTSGAIDIHGLKPRHPLIGGRVAQGIPEWRTVLDAELVPYLADHVVGGETIVPATALAEMALAVARDVSPDGPLSIVDFDIVQAMAIPAEGQREVSVRYASGTGSVEIYSRPRFGPDEWTLCARGLIAGAPGVTGIPPAVTEGTMTVDADAIYRTACDTGIDYGASFRLLRRLRRDDDKIIEVDLDEADQDVGIYSRRQILHPASVDAGFHGLFDLLEIDPNLRQAWVPIRFERLTVWRDHAAVTNAVIVVDRDSEHLKTVTLWLRDASGAVVARIDRALLRPVVLAQKSADDGLYHLTYAPAGLRAGDNSTCEVLAAHLAARPAPEASEGRLLLRAHMWACVHRTLSSLAEANGAIDVGRLVAPGWSPT
jgi:phthiocerol/phenolphthiocerol synthesis type-I polyketide synthase C